MNTQSDMLNRGNFTQEDYAEFDTLRVGVLAQFDQTVELLFDGKPFQSSQPEPPELPHTDQQEAVYLHIQASDGNWDYTLYVVKDPEKNFLLE